ncbi:MAG TPA: lysylphosphatidylglycerol synthase transmembrane domain-containing protein [Chloroflexota bacterium]
MISAGCGYLLLRTLNAQALLSALLDFNALWLLPGLALYFVGVWLRGLRWKVLLDPLVELPGRSLFRLQVIGFTVNDLLPARVGELARAYVLWRETGVRPSSTLGTIALERLLDGVVLVSFLGIAWLALPLGRFAVVAWVAGGVFLAAAVGCAVALRWPEWLLRALTLLSRPAPPRLRERLVGVARGFIEGLGAVRSGRALARALALTALAWLSEVGMYFVLMLGFPMTAGVPGAFVGAAVANLGTMVPSSPGYVGTFDLPLQQVLVVLFDQEPNIAATYTLLVHAVLVVPVVVLGLIFLWQANIGLGDLSRRDVAVVPQRIGGAPGVASDGRRG